MQAGPAGSPGKPLKRALVVPPLHGSTIYNSQGWKQALLIAENKPVVARRKMGDGMGDIVEGD